MKNLKLEAFGVQELDAKEIQETIGGAAPPFWLVGVGIYLFDNREKVKQGFADAIYDLTHF
ncbi:hypothetical protein HDC90_000694 [Pedobacter sp. AK013]|uniref:hypothetical protein n=1 Tax=Pedobacter sp. AK013 TaxID=2723071 RepID=UPI00161DCC61|nr:hypothetical protein [Pedobacter sp. AK013]MBB6236088.1 hypothetical protein [Pedobacter sp. AK013]